MMEYAPAVFALLYWGGVVVNAVRIRRRTGKTPSVEPRGAIDWILWAAWLTLIVLWAGSPWFAGPEDRFFDFPATRIAGIAVACVAVAETWRCYRILGNAWAISVNESRTTELVRSGSYGVVRHPIYSLQWLLLFGVFLAHPTAPVLAALVLLTLAMQWKARIEERKLGELFGEAYEEYSRETGRFVPRLRGSRKLDQ